MKVSKISIMPVNNLSSIASHFATSNDKIATQIKYRVAGFAHATVGISLTFLQQNAEETPKLLRNLEH